MSLYVTLVINDEPIGNVTITRNHDDNGTDLDAVNAYRWKYSRDGTVQAAGTVSHRYGDGAVELVHAVFGEIAALERISASAIHAIGGDA